MDQVFVEKTIETAVQDAVGEKAIALMKGVSKLASMQGGETDIENYKLLAKRALIVGGVTIVTLKLVSWAIGTAVARKNEEKRTEEIVRRILAEERAKEAAAR